jgi:SAM-dependent methyltransferase
MREVEVAMEPNINQFNRDVAQNEGYLYSTNARLSSEMANTRLTDATLAAISFEGKRVIDIGCGDGTYSIEVFRRGRPAMMHSIDPAEQAIEIARKKTDDGSMTFASHDAYALPYGDDSFDIAHIRGVLHHMDRPVDALREAFRVARNVVVIEPNGYNPGLKLLERVSPYHRAHDEKSYPPHGLDRWVRSLGAEVTGRQWVGLVPMFCPDVLARVAKSIEPIVERLPIISKILCAQYVFVGTRNRGSEESQ